MRKFVIDVEHLLDFTSITLWKERGEENIQKKMVYGYGFAADTITSPMKVSTSIKPLIWLLKRPQKHDGYMSMTKR